jgi:hypothetical protein
MREEREVLPARGTPPGPFSRHTDWLAVAIVGAVVLLIGIYKPATRWIGGPQYYGTDWIAVGIALLGGVLLGIGLSKWYDLRPEGPAARRRPPSRVDASKASNLSSFEVYRGGSEGSKASKRPKG